ncbi:hypothetical protein M3G91_24490 [Micromonospora chalcea]|uniref:hypothetical protein n=1 Tax=Micromonospora chalcea TaxID=1874 RepID=UPI0021A8A4AE|nr:hypothetical protein [Micromonospora chalcea]MCT2280780.1 hypothetical protein [Micromonospora chalcea]
MTTQRRAELCGGPLDGRQQTTDRDNDLVLALPVPTAWAEDPTTNPQHLPLKNWMLYVRRIDPATGRGATNSAGQPLYDFRGYA